MAVEQTFAMVKPDGVRRGLTGTIIAMPVEEGARVTAGETVLAEVDQVWSRLARQRYEAELKSAEAMLEFELVEFERYQKLTDEDAISRSQLELKAATIAGLRADSAKSRTAMEEEDERIARSTIRAPLDGVVVAKHAERGSHVTVGAPLLVVGNAILEFDQGTLTVGKTLTGLLAIVAMLVVATVASEVLARAVLGSRDGSSEDHSDRR